ncbi:hypothetical protein B0T13DRAFT_392078, partial [Neurospora crassa]
VARITNKVRSELLTEYLAIKYIEFNIITSFFIYYTLLHQYIKDTKFKIDNNFDITLLYNTVKIIYPIDARY